MRRSIISAVGMIADSGGVQTRQFTPQEIVDSFANALGVMPSGGRQMNRYGVEERGGDDLAGFDTAAGEEEAPPGTRRRGHLRR